MLTDEQQTVLDTAVRALNENYHFPLAQKLRAVLASAAPVEGREPTDSPNLTIEEGPRDGNWRTFKVNGHRGFIRIVGRMEEDEQDLPLGEQVAQFLLTASAPTMSKADIKQWRWVTANGTCSDWQDTSDDEIENLAENPPSRGGYYEARKLCVVSVGRIDRAAAEGESDEQ